MGHLKILFITDGISPFVIGGMQQHSTKMVKCLLEKGVEIHLIHTTLDSSIPQSSEVENTFSHRKALKTTFIPFPSKDQFIGHYIRNSKLYSKEVFKVVEQNLMDFDFVYAQGFTAHEFLKRKIPKLPIISNLHGLEMFQGAADMQSELKNWLLKPIARYILNNSDINISLGGTLTGLIKQNTSKKTTVWKVPNFIDQSWFKEYKRSENHKNIKFLFIGRYERRKGIEELLGSIPLINSNNAFFGFVGNLHTIENERCKFHGLVKDEQTLKQIIDEYDVLICPSYSEGMPTVILEAMARGLAIIATDVGAVSELVNKENGWLIPARSQYRLIEAIELAIKCEELEIKKDQSVKKAVEFETHKVMDRLLDYLVNFKKHHLK
jgi:glycosyltransferase involved in cell wall biosynthesis